MADDIPWKTLDTDFGPVPFYLVQFDKHGTCTSPRALDELVERSAGRSDVLMFSHGWNNDFATATARYERFIDAFVPVRRKHWASPERTFEPVLAGVVWPSTALVAPWERGPDIAGVDSGAQDVAALLDALDPVQQQRLREVLAKPTATEEEAVEVAGMIGAAFGQGDDEIGLGGRQVEAEELLETWKAAPVPVKPQGEAGGFIDDDDATTTAPEAAGFNPLDWVRKGVRLATVQLMKDRAGTVGGHGVADMLRALTTPDSPARVSLVGHSYGAKVVLSALANGPAPSRPVDSVLLLQPALSCYAFTDDLDGQRGGYRPALDRDRVRQPIITTRSGHDEPLTKFFHLAVRRKSDLAEAQIAATPPSKFAALGGYGPQGVPGGAEKIDMPAVGEPYPLATSRRVIDVNGTAYIAGHGNVERPETAWALLSQLKG